MLFTCLARNICLCTMFRPIKLDLTFNFVQLIFHIIHVAHSLHMYVCIFYNHHASVVIIFTTNCALKHYSNVNLIITVFYNMFWVRRRNVLLRRFFYVGRFFYALKTYI